MLISEVYSPLEFGVSLSLKVEVELCMYVFIICARKNW